VTKIYEDNAIWTQKGAALSDKSARQEFGLTQQEILAAMRAGKLQFREGNMHGNPWFRLLRHEVEALVGKKGGPGYQQFPAQGWFWTVASPPRAIGAVSRRTCW
jgi:hypothetical protein